MSKKVSPLRQRMIDDMKMRNMALTTQSIYVSAVARFSAFHGRSPDKLGIEDVRDYRLHLISRNLNPNTINPITGALRFFYGTTLGRKDIADQIPYARRADALPAVLSREEVERLLRATPSLKMRTAFITIYAAGLRVSELVAAGDDRAFSCRIPPPDFLKRLEPAAMAPVGGVVVGAPLSLVAAGAVPMAPPGGLHGRCA